MRIAEWKRQEHINKALMVWAMKTKPFVLSLSKHERRSEAPYSALK